MKTKYMQSTHNPFNSQGKMFHHTDKLNLYKKGGNPTPIMLEINLTNICNMDCKWCISKYSHKKESIKTNHLLRFLAEFKEAGGKAVNWSGGGEPTCHPDFEEIARTTKEIGLDQGLMTNGVYPFEYNKVINECCKWVRFSLDTSSPKRYEEIKGIKAHSKVLKNVDAITIKKGINMNLPQEEFDWKHDILDLFVICQQREIGYFQIRPVLPAVGEIVNKKILYKQIELLRTLDGLGDIITISWDKFNDLLDNAGARTYTKCRGHNFEAVVDANGDFDVCMYHLKNPDFVFGNIYIDSFDEIWISERRDIVKEHCDNLDMTKCQVCCKCHEINKLLDYIDNEETEDINFI